MVVSQVVKRKNGNSHGRWDSKAAMATSWGQSKKQEGGESLASYKEGGELSGGKCTSLNSLEV